jgi:hypothetical protein
MSAAALITPGAKAVLVLVSASVLGGADEGHCPLRQKGDLVVPAEHLPPPKHTQLKTHGQWGRGR